MDTRNLLGALLGVLRGLRILGGLQRGGSTARRVCFGLAVFGALAYTGGADAGTIAGGLAFLFACGWVGYNIIRRVRVLARRGNS